MQARATHRGRIAAAALIALAGCLAIALAATTKRSAADPGDQLLPDLVTLRPPALVMPKHPKRVLLRLSNEVGNQGSGPLEIFPSDASENCDGDQDPSNDRSGFQRIFVDSDDSGSPGYFDRNADTAGAIEHPTGCIVYHPKHNHWHFADFARYVLYREDTGKIVARQEKVSFCLVDSDTPFASQLPGQQPAPYYPNALGCDETATVGLSVGWADIYGYYLPGQQLDLSGHKRGNFCLLSTADPPSPGLPNGHIEESDESNNSYGMRLHISTKRRTVQSLGGSCKMNLPKG